MKTEFYIFFSWQSDVAGNRNYIDKKIKDAISEILNMPQMNGIKITYDHSTQNRSGSPAIAETIHEKINMCDVFIADVTPVTSLSEKNADGEKLIPNPNVMTEAGFALRAIGDKRIILLMRKNTGKIDDLPFDIRHRRITLFPNDAAKKQAFSLTTMIRSAIEYSQSYQAEEHQDREVKHDSNIFKGLANEIGDGKNFIDTVSRITSCTQISRSEYNLFDKITAYIENPDNQFIIPELNSLATDLYKGIKALTLITAQYYSPSRTWWVSPDSDMTPEEVADADNRSFYVWIDKASGEYLDEETYRKKLSLITKGLGDAYDQIIKAYWQFRQEVKRNLFI